MVDETYEEIPSNVKSVLFDAEQSAYLVGLIAGKMSETKNVGFIGGLDIPVINTFKYGYMAGVKTQMLTVKYKHNMLTLSLIKQKVKQ